MTDCVLSMCDVSVTALARHTRSMPLNSGNAPVAAPTDTLHRMRIDRAYRVKQLVGEFTMLSTSQIKRLVFPDVTQTPCDRVLQKLVRSGELHIVSKRYIGGENVYTSNKRIKTVDPHALAIADTYIACKEQALTYAVGADAWVKVAGCDLRPDMYLELGTENTLYLFIEVDLDSEGKKKLEDKIDRYKYAYDNAQDYPGDVFPLVVWLVPDEHRKREIERLTGDDALFRVELQRDFPLHILQP